MKKYFLPAIFCIITGFIMSRIMFNQYDTKLVSATIDEKAYFFQVGVFSNLDNMKKEVSRYSSYIYIKEDDKYYVYIGMTIDNKEKLKNYFDTLEYTTYIKEMPIDSSFVLKLKEYDEELKKEEDESKIEEIINNTLKSYEEFNNDKN